ncbi:PQQ-binding-like beta-propeller repeat protein [uncultured Arcticibacterium sp.]|uniref:outer membrane protein assembly factor BamB family protein n=1 Tax=uncultured Arcticibacterium sp. TaxID=2173042 RepID=UPI0030F8CA56
MKQFLLFASVFLIISSCADKTTDYSKWTNYGGTKDASRYSSLEQINVENVKNLDVAWEYHTGDASENSQIQCQPIIVDSILYATTPKLSLVALHVETGNEIWRFDPFEVLGGENSWAGTNRGVTYFKEGDTRRILFCAGSYLMSVDAITGKPDLSFGDKGKVDLQIGLSENSEDQFLVVSNTPGIIYGDKIIMGMRLSEGLDAAPGHIRAYNVKTGKQEWVFHTIPKKGELGYDTWDEEFVDKIGGANNWAGLTLDEERGIVYVPTGSATYDFWGGFRKGDNLFANSLIALNAATGERVWHYQLVHHDVWDRDIPSNPNLVTINKDGKKIDAIAQITKHGYVFMFDRETGEPIFPIEEKTIPENIMDGEFASATQPIPTLPEAFMRQEVGEKDLLNITPELEREVKGMIEGVEYGNMWLAPSQERPFLLFPGFDGGGEWGGAAVDPESGIMYVNANEMPWLIEMIPNEAAKLKKGEISGSSIYANNCANCHGADRMGNTSAFPKLVGLAGKYDSEEVHKILKNGRGGMPSFKHIAQAERDALVNFLLEKEEKGVKKELSGGKEKLTTPYLMNGYKRFLTKDGYPGINPPWGTLNAIDLNSGKILWKTPLGEFPELTAKGIPITGRENYGGPVVTKGGVIFIGATEDEMFRAFDKKTGKVLWETKLPAGGHATPSVYEWKGKQYVVIACGGGKSDKSGDSYLAFALPEISE